MTADSFSLQEFLLCMGLIIGLMSRVFANGPADRGSIPRWKKRYSMQLCLALSTIR